MICIIFVLLLPKDKNENKTTPHKLRTRKNNISKVKFVCKFEQSFISNLPNDLNKV